MGLTTELDGMKLEWLENPVGLITELDGMKLEWLLLGT